MLAMILTVKIILLVAKIDQNFYFKLALNSGCDEEKEEKITKGLKYFEWQEKS